MRVFEHGDRDPQALAASAPDAERVMGELKAAVTRQAERTHIHMLAAEALMFGADPECVRTTAGLNDLEQHLVTQLCAEFADDDAVVEDEARKRAGSFQAVRK
jgi:hypothetical protein